MKIHNAKIYRINYFKVTNAIYKRISNFPVFIKINRRIAKEIALPTLPEGNMTTSKVLIIRYCNYHVGLMAMVRTIVYQLIYADKNGYIPVIDMKTFYNFYHTNETIGKINIWDLYFEQPAGVLLDEAKFAKNLILSKFDSVEMDSLFSDEVFSIAKKYLRFSDRINKIVDSKWDFFCKNLNKKNPRILGVKLRGSDYLTMRPKGHAVPPTLEVAISKIDEKLNEWGEFDAIYLSTEDENISNVLRNKYKGFLLENNHKRVENNNDWARDLANLEDKIKSGDDYAVDIALLVRCNSLIASGCQGTTVARWLKQDCFENLYVFELGLYE